MSNNTLKLLTLGASLMNPKDRIKQQQTDKRLELKEREIQLKEATQRQIDYNNKVTPFKVSSEKLLVKIGELKHLVKELDNEHIGNFTKDGIKDRTAELESEILNLAKLLGAL